ncbi:hypothetical protein DV713_12250 [Parageobacillus thermoglucosidasius]|nr:hypothetical protein DV713_12250 [Parageobacillus thermoglucosidasius]
MTTQMKSRKIVQKNQQKTIGFLLVLPFHRTERNFSAIIKICRNAYSFFSTGTINNCFITDLARK